MKIRSVVVHSSICAGMVLAYMASYAAIRMSKPACINTNDGPIGPFNAVYYPLRFLDAEKPDWYSIARGQDGWLSATIHWINRGNGYLYFRWKGQTARAFNPTEHHFEEDELVELHFKFHLETQEDFTTYLVATIDDIRTAAASVEHRW